MQNDPYRHSVWIDVFGVVLFGALLVGGAGYLLYHAEDAAPGHAVESARDVKAPAPMQRHRSVRPSRSSRGSGGRKAQNRTSNPLLSSRSTTVPGRAVPFSRSWRGEATPTLTESPSASGGGALGSTGGAGPRSEESSIASSRSFGSSGTGGNSREAENRSVGSSWRAEARRLGSRTRALSGALRQMNRESSEGRDDASSQKETSSETAASGGRARSSDRTVPNPPDPVPIDDHLHWLVVAGLLWGVWRIGRGA